MFATPAFAQAASGAAASSGAGGTIFFLGQFLLIGLIFWFLMIRPQQAKLKAHRAKMDAVKKGDTVVTAAGSLAK